MKYLGVELLNRYNMIYLNKLRELLFLKCLHNIHIINCISYLVFAFTLNKPSARFASVIIIMKLLISS